MRRPRYLISLTLNQFLLELTCVYYPLILWNLLGIKYRMEHCIKSTHACDLSTVSTIIYTLVCTHIDICTSEISVFHVYVS